MVNILLSRYDISKRWCFDELKKYIRKGSRVAVLAFSFRDSEISCKEEWDKFYGLDGVLSSAINKAFKHYSIDEDCIEYINYFTDSPAAAKSKLENADIIFFPGGAAENFMLRVIRFDLYHTIENHRGVIIGFGAGAQVQLANYHINKGEGKMCYSLGFRFADGFNVETNYTGSDRQNYIVKRVVSEKGLPVYAIGEEGCIIVEGDIMRVLGEVHCFQKREAAG
ncbi:MAG: Type 1 glutamine amidotransferase-like domain-containing protein [Oscillospiraceae bacterium]|nr:Type 1 glutamine amidotransferase-like domain-containing protein [Oscillospiraceae bacterium]